MGLLFLLKVNALLDHGYYVHNVACPTRTRLDVQREVFTVLGCGSGLVCVCSLSLTTTYQLQLGDRKGSLGSRDVQDAQRPF